MSLVLNVEILGNYKNLTQATQGAQKNLEALGKKFATVGKNIAKVAAGIGVGLGAAVISQVKPSIDAASDLEQQMGALESVFKDLAPGMKDFAKDQYNIGLSTADAARNMTLLGSQLKGYGLPVDEAADKTKQLTLLAADLAATFGGTTSDAVASIGSLFRGEYDPIEKYGVAIKKSDVNARMAAEGLDKLEGEALKMAEAQTALNLLFEKTTDAQGQAAREMDTAAAKSEKLKATFENLQAEIGTALLPMFVDMTTYILEDIIPAVEDFWYWLTDPSSDAQLQIRAVKEGWEKFGISFGKTSNDITGQNVFGWLSDSLVSIEKMIVHFGTTMSEIWGGIQLLMMGPLHFAAGFRKIAGAIGEADKAAEQIKFWDQLANVSERERQQAPPAARMTPSRILGTSVGADTAARQGDVTAGGTVIYNNNVYVKKSTATGQDIATALNRTIKAAGVQVIRAQ